LDDGLRPVTAGGIDLAWAVANLAPKEPVITGLRRVRCSQRGPRWFERRGRSGRDGGLPLINGASGRFPRRERYGRNLRLAREFGLVALMFGIGPETGAADDDNKRSRGRKPFCKAGSSAAAFALGRWQ